MPETSPALEPQAVPEPEKGGSYVRHPQTLQLERVEATQDAPAKLRSEPVSPDSPTDLEA